MATLAQVLANIEATPNWCCTSFIRAYPLVETGVLRMHIYLVVHRTGIPDQVKGNMTYIHIKDFGVATEDASVVDFGQGVDRLPFIVKAD